MIINICTINFRIFSKIVVQELIKLAFFPAKDELQVTTRNYEGQLSMMSEHLAGMNEKLTTQADEINSLKYQIQQQGKVM